MAKEVAHKAFASGPVVDLRQLYLEINAFVAPIAYSSGVESIRIL